MGADDGGEFLRSCAHCGKPLRGDELYPVVADSNDDGEPVLRSFCDDECRRAWEGDSD